MSDTRAAPVWPSVAEMRERFAELVFYIADERVADLGGPERTAYVVAESVRAHVGELSEALVIGAEMALDAWLVARVEA